MISQEIIDYIKNELARGVSEADLRKALSDAGWQATDIEEGFININTPSIQLSSVEQPVQKRSKKPFLIILILVIVLAIIAGVIFFIIPILNKNSANAQDIPPFDDSDLRVKNIEVLQEQNAFYELNKIKDAKIKFPDGYTDDPDDKDKNGRQLIRDIYDEKTQNQELSKEIVSKNQDILMSFNEMDKKTAFKELLIPDFNKVDFNSKYSAVNPANIFTITQIKVISIILLSGQGKTEESLSEAMRIISIGQKMKEGQIPFVGKMVGVGIQGIGLETARKVIANSSPTNEVMNNYLHNLNGLKDFSDALKSSAKIEIYLSKANTIDLINKEGVNALEENIFGDDPKIIEGFKNPKYFQPNKTKLIFAEDAREQINNINLPCGASAGKKIEAELRAEEIRNEIKSGKIFFFSENAIGKLTYGYTALVLNLAKRKCEAEFPVAATKVFLALKMYKNDKGDLPVALDELAPQYLQVIPQDPFDGKSMKYSKENKLIYGVGMDGVDAGGSGDDQNIKINF